MNEQIKLRKMNNASLVAYWNILQYPTLKAGADQTARHRPLVSEILTERGIPHQCGRRTVLAR